MADLLPTDKLLVNRAGTDHSVLKSDVMATVQDTDLFLVNRGNVDYQASYADVKKGFGPQHIDPAPGDWTFNPAVVSGTGTELDPYVLTASSITVPDRTATADQVMTLTGLNPDDLVEWTDHSTGAGTRFHQSLSLVPPSGQVDLQLVFNDLPNTATSQVYNGLLQIGTTWFKWDVTMNVAVPPDIDTAVLTEDDPAGDRFTSQAFTTTVTMIEDGIPASTKGIKGWVEGALQQRAETSAITAVTAGSGPSATMHGLRFDPSRKTSFQQGSTTGNRKTFTVSAWYKATGTSGQRPLLGVTDVATQNRIQISSSNALSFVWDQGNESVSTSNTVPLNQWTHAVVSVDTTQAAETDRVKIYINGNRESVSAGNVYPTLNQEFSYNSGLPHTVGYFDDGGGGGLYWDGYLSDFYLVDGQALEPTAFGADYGGNWGPLDSSVVKTNIGAFGANGFYLPFDPAATGKVWSQSLTLNPAHTGTTQGFDNPAQGFDGDPNTRCGISIPDNLSGGGTITFTTPDVACTSLKIKLLVGSNGTATITANGAVENAAANTNGVITFASPPAIFNGFTIDCTNTTPSPQGCYLYTVEVNGKILVDHNNIGVDDSGNDNHFHDSNFGVGDTSQVWSAGTTTNGNPGVPVSNCFNGDLTDFMSAPSGNNQRWDHTFTNKPTVNTSLRVYAGGHGVAAAGGPLGVKIGTSEYSATPIDKNAQWLSIAGWTPGDTIDGVFGSRSSTGNGGTVSAWEIDGKILIDKNIQDTVLDTPMNDYAVLATGTNGNLVASADGTSITYLGEAGTNYYYEVNGVGAVHAGTATFSSTNGKVYNFGQQPFARKYDYSEKWSDGAKTGSSIDPGVRDWAQAFDGITPATASANVVGSTPGEYEITLANPRAFTKSCRIYAQTNPNNTALAVKVNGTTVNSRLTTSLGWADITDLITSPLVSLSVEGETGRSTYVGAIEVDGEILVDSDAALVDALNNNLFQSKESDTVLTLTDNTGFTGIAVGDKIDEKGNGDDASGTVKVVDGAAVPPTITVEASTGTWDVGSTVLGPWKVQDVTKTLNSDEITNVDVVSTIYSDNVTLTNAAWNGPLANGFDGDTTTTASTDSFSNTNDKIIQIVFNPAIPVNTSLRIYMQESSLVTRSVSINGGGYTEHPGSGGMRWFDATSKVTGGQVGTIRIKGSTTTLGQAGIGWRAIEVDGVILEDNSITTLTFASDKDLADFAAGDAINQEDTNASGTVGSVDVGALTMTLATSTGTWGPANAGHYVIGPTKTIPATNVKLYTTLDASLNVTDLQSADPGFTAFTGLIPKITFPALLPSGQAPDVDLPAGTTVQTEVEASNASGTDTQVSNVVTPA